MSSQFPHHKPEDADLSKVPGYTGHPGQDRVKPDLKSQQEHSAQGYADKKKPSSQEEKVPSSRKKAEKKEQE